MGQEGALAKPVTLMRAFVAALLLLAQPASVRSFAPARGARGQPRGTARAAARERAFGSQDALAVPLGAAALFGVIANRLLFAGELCWSFLNIANPIHFRWWRREFS